ncbi:MAG TPA: GGDEF domain-containing protein [candidate division Zixibacteria bacterium]|nr:GGDEF domain-containing protein [candidate division Zixibacteria bacterium]
MSLTGIDSLLVIALTVAVSVVVWLYFRLHSVSTSIRYGAVKREDDFFTLLSANALGGDIAQVASRVSNMMIEDLGCELIVFMRKKRGNLICNYSYGLIGLNRRDFRMAYSRQIFETVKLSFRPRPIGDLSEHLSSTMRSNLELAGADWFFPVYWHENLYGIYFIRANDKMININGLAHLASMAQCLSAAYHIKWFETKREVLLRNVDDLKQKVEAVETPVNGQTSILHLVKQLDSDALVHKILQVVREELGLGRAVYLYRNRTGQTGLKLVKSGIKGPIETPSVESFETLVKSLANDEATNLGRFKPVNETTDKLLDQLKNSGFDFVAPFSLSDQQEGILAFSGDRKVLDDKRLSMHREQATQILEIADSYHRIEEMSFTDDLTGLANKRYLLKRLDEEIARASRYRRHLTLILFDLDELKVINDRYGHQAGDQVLQQLGYVLRQSIRSIDIVARYGGDEFCIIMPETDSEMAEKFMTRLQRDIAGRKFEVEAVGTISCTVSLGGAVYPDNGDDRDKLIYAADMALLKAKEAGRNLALLAATEENSNRS